MSASPARLPSREPLLWLVAIAVFMQMLDTTIVNTALPAMARSLGESPLRMQWVVIAYALSVAVLIPASGWLADRFGTRRVFIAAIMLFMLGSLACAWAQTLGHIIAARVLQGVGGAMLLPVGRLAVLRTFPGPDFLRAMSFVTVPGLVGPLIGPALGGWLVEVASWHWIFLINLPIGAIGLLSALRVMPDLRSPVHRFDLAGYGLLAFGRVSLSLALDGLSIGQRVGGVAILAVFGLAAVAAYWLHAARDANALFPLRLFGVASYRIGIIGNLFSRLGTSGMPFLIPLLLQVALGYSPTAAGLAMIPVALAGMAAKRIVVPLVARFGYRRVLVGNTVLVGLAMASFALIGPGQPVGWHVVQFAAFGAVNSLQFTAMNTITLRDLGGGLASAGNSLLSMTMMLGVGFGVAVAGGLLGAFAELPGGSASGSLTAFRWSFVSIGVITLASAAIFWQLPDAAPAAVDGESGRVGPG